MNTRLFSPLHFRDTRSFFFFSILYNKYIFGGPFNGFSEFHLKVFHIINMFLTFIYEIENFYFPREKKQGKANEQTS